ncbi:phytoene desaturase family protein [Cohnella abietis]|uniref:Dehydrosqualene desaturase n=1 Tax=Cohnella abietis TaxID=2507935 RepID=A0A3T1D6D6_9BACL|nr:phytoene desaturase family protein [Cohnella abietis]BBI33631.1 dehydrosqualene desaturase [Cohnella abietis]
MEVAIVGGGIGGMTVALLLSKQGHSVTLYEKNRQLGGRLAYQQIGVSRIDQGPTIVLLPEMILSILEEAGVERSRIPLIPCDPMHRIHYTDGTVFHKWRDTARQAQEVEEKFPHEGDGFKRFMREMETVFGKGKEAFLERPFLRKRDFWNYRNVALLNKLQVFRSVREVAAKYFRDEKLKDAYSLQTLYIGGAPYRSPGLYSLLPFAEHAYGVWYFKGGYAGLSLLLEDELRSRGVNIQTDTEIDELIVEKGRCHGVVTSSGQARFDSVIYNGEFPGLSGLMRGKARPRFKSFVPSSGCVLVYLSVAKRWENSAVHQFFLPESLTDQLRHIFDEGKLPDEPSYYVFNPIVIDADAAPSDESVLCVLIPVPSIGKVNWSEETPALVDYVLDNMQQRAFPGLREAMIQMVVRTPEDASADGLYQGGSFGIAPILTQSAAFRPQIVPYPIQGLYAVGASVHPGGGIPIVMQGAKMLAQHLSKEWEHGTVSLPR